MKVISSSSKPVQTGESELLCGHLLLHIEILLYKKNVSQSKLTIIFARYPQELLQLQLQYQSFCYLLVEPLSRMSLGRQNVHGPC